MKKAENKKKRTNRERTPKPVDTRSGHIKDSTQQRSLMKPFYFGPDED